MGEERKNQVWLGESHLTGLKISVWDEKVSFGET